MLYDLLQTKHIYIVCGKTDLRKGIDGLASLIQQEYQLETFKERGYGTLETIPGFQTSLLGR
ncbi:hypothetical protein EfmJHP36_04090 [Enterococcus faecium]|nr:hypothetical protein EfmJHP36_04090 [Enterococcus faecium]